MKYSDAYNEYLEKIAFGGQFLRLLPAAFKSLWNPGRNIAMAGAKGMTGGQFLKSFARKYPAQIGLTGLGGLAANRAGGNIAYGKREPGESRGLLGLGGLL